MRVLVVGGSGKVGRMVLPLLDKRFELRVFDRNPPPFPVWEYVQGNVTDLAALRPAAEEMDALFYMAMGTGPRKTPQDPGSLYDVNDATAAYDVNVKGVHMALQGAVEAGIKRAVYTSSLSVYDGHLDIRSGVTDREDVPPAPTTVYGFTKRLGEQVFERFHRAHRLPVLILRLFLPVTQADWKAKHDPAHVDCRTSAPDLARAFTAALDFEHDGFEIVHVTGDHTGRAYHHEKAKRLLGWEPLERP
jgi:nucleoside-diphosphate-sugar epimerase